jgi:hypothetical protein
MEHGPYIAERTQTAVYIVRCVWERLGVPVAALGYKETGYSSLVAAAGYELHVQHTVRHHVVCSPGQCCQLMLIIF